MVDPGEGTAPPLFLDQTETRRTEKKIFFETALLYLKVWMTGPPLSEGLDPPLVRKQIVAERVLKELKQTKSMRDNL